MAARPLLSLYLILAFAWCEETQAFSSLFSRTKTMSPSTSSFVTKDIYGVGIMRSRIESLHSQMGIVAMPPSASPLLIYDTRMAMATNDSSDDSSGENTEATTKEDKGDAASSNTQKNNAILVFPLFCKFMVVLLIKFLTDLVVFPSLLLFRLARRMKRKLLELIGKIPLPGSSPASIKPNGSAK